MSSHLYLLGNEEASDQLYPGVFLLNGHPYHIMIKPNSPEWDISLKVFLHELPEEIDRFDFSPEPDQVVLELAFSVFMDASILRVKSIHSGDLEHGVEKGRIPFSSGEHVDVYFHYDAKAEKIYLYTEVDDNKPLFIECPGLRMAGFEIATGQPLSGMQVEVEVKEIVDGHLPDEQPFQVGNVIFRNGNIYDEEIMNRTNVLLLPVSAGGLVEPYVYKMLLNYKLPLPTPGQQGKLNILPEVQDKSARFIPIFAYTIENDSLGKEVIVGICEELTAVLQSKSKFIRVNLPLIGLDGPNDLFDPGDIAQIYSDMFKHPWLNMEFIVSIPDKTIFDRIRQRYKLGVFPVISFRKYEKPQSIQLLEAILGIRLRLSEFGLNKDGEISWLVLKNKTIISSTNYLGELEILEHLKHLNINGSSFLDYSFLNKLDQLEKLDAAMSNISVDDLKSLNFLKSLDLGNKQIQDIQFIEGFKSLHTLDLRGNNITDINVLKSLPQLTNLCLRNNHIIEISPLENLVNLQYLDLSSNSINNIRPLSRLVSLESLNLADNDISDISPLRTLQLLERLDVSYNQITSATAIRNYNNLKVLKINDNPLTEVYNIILNKHQDNHYLTVLGALLRSEEKGDVLLRLPVKVLVLGNHKVGKSSMVHYLEENDLPEPHKIESTHIVSIVRHYGWGVEKKGIPKMIFYDFGGQDYYHGLYRIFMSNEAIYLILWNHLSNCNRPIVCSKNYSSRDFTVDYWLAQKRYIEHKRCKEPGDPLVIIQTYGDEKNRMNFTRYHSFSELPGEFHVSFYKNAVFHKNLTLNKDINDLMLQSLRASLDNIADRIEVIKKEPYWYTDFINYIIQEADNTKFESHHVEHDILPNYKHKETNRDLLLQFLRADLEQLHLRGLILYYPNDFPDKVWLNPQGVVQYIHDEILGRKDIESGLISKETGKDLDALLENEIFQLLKAQGVIFHHKADDTYIIPNFLRLSDDKNVEMVMLKFGLGNPCFTLKFTEFIPFGLINQIICFFGQLPDKKKFWRDQLLFMIDDKVKVLINVDFQLLEIKVYTHFIEPYDKKEDIRTYLFYGIMGLYWDMELFDMDDFSIFKNNRPESDNIDVFEIERARTDEQRELLKKALAYAYSLYFDEHKVPDDLYITVDGKIFVRYSELFKLKGEKVLVNYKWEDRRMVRNSFNVPTYHYQAFTNIPMNKPLQCVISYSQKDAKILERFLYYLNPLIDDGLIEAPWYDLGLRAGDEWDPEISRRFEQADIIFFLVTEHLMGTRYVMDFELKCAIHRWEAFKANPLMNKPMRIVPILPVTYPWKRVGRYDLSKFSALPYKGMPIDRFPVERYGWNNVAEGIAVMIKQGIMKRWEEEVNIDEHLTEYMEYLQHFTDGKLSGGK